MARRLGARCGLGALLLASLLQRCTGGRPECRLVVVEAGAPRTGSTQQNRLALLALTELGLGDHVSDAGYFEYEKHASLNASATAEHLRELKARRKPLSYR